MMGDEPDAADRIRRLPPHPAAHLDEAFSIEPFRMDDYGIEPVESDAPLENRRRQHHFYFPCTHPLHLPAPPGISAMD